MDGRKSTGEDQIPAKLLLLAADELALPLTNAMNNCMHNHKFPENVKLTTVCPVDKRGANRRVERNFHPFSILNVFSKIYEKVLKIQLVSYLDETLSLFIAAYRRSYGTQHVLIRKAEEWKIKLDNDYILGAILMDLSKVFDCIPHDLIITKLHTYGFDGNSLVLVYSYLKERKQSVTINNTYSSFQTILADVPQGSVLGPILFSLYINDLILLIKEATLCNYADDNASNLIGVLEEEAGVALN